MMRLVFTIFLQNFYNFFTVSFLIFGLETGILFA